MNLTTADRYMTLFPESKASASDSGYVGSLNMRINSVSRSVEKYLDRKLETAERSDYFTPSNGVGTKTVRVSAFPIVSIESVKLGGVELDSSYYTVNKETGVISFVTQITRDTAIPYEDSLCVTYTGGMATNTASFIELFPDIEIEVLTQIRFEIMRVKDIAMKSVATGQTTAQLNPYGFLDALVAVLDRYRPLGWA